MACLAPAKQEQQTIRRMAGSVFTLILHHMCKGGSCDMPGVSQKLTGSSYPAEIWKNYMDQIHADLTPIDFLPYAQISDDYQDSQETQDTPADDQTQNNPTDQTVTTHLMQELKHRIRPQQTRIRQMLLVATQVEIPETIQTEQQAEIPEKTTVVTH